MDQSLLDQIATSGSEDELRVYADELILRGDSFGELIVVASERLVRDTPELRRREEALVADHTERLRGLLDGSRQTFRWRRGFVDAIEFDYAGDEPFVALPKLANEPAVRLVRRLVWDTPVIGDSRGMAPIFAELAQLAVRFPRLVEIVVREGSLEMPWMIGSIDINDVTPLYSAFPGLEVLELDGENVDLGDIVLPSLRRLRVTRLALEDIRRIVAARMPRLEDLELAFRSEQLDNIPATFGPLLHRDFGPQLVALSLTPTTVPAIRWVMTELPTCPLARHVRRLAFRHILLDDDLLQPLIANAPAWQRLDRLELHAQSISAGTMRQLRKAFGGRLALV